jgi:hypothetical protein
VKFAEVHGGAPRFTLIISTRTRFGSEVRGLCARVPGRGPHRRALATALGGVAIGAAGPCTAAHDHSPGRSYGILFRAYGVFVGFW